MSELRNTPQLYSLLVLRKIVTLTALLCTSALACNQKSLESFWGVPALGPVLGSKCIDALVATILIGGDNTAIMYGDLSSGRLDYKGSLKDVYSKVNSYYKQFPEYKTAKFADKSKDSAIMVVDMLFTKKLRDAYKGYGYPEYVKNARLMIFMSEGAKKPGYTSVAYLMYTPNP